MNCRKTALTVLLLITAAAGAQAQDTKIEFTPYFGYTASSGVDVSPLDIGGGRAITKVSPKSSFAWGLDFDYFASQQFSIGFNWSQQLSKLKGEATPVVPTPASTNGSSLDIADMNVYTYHGIFTYNFGDGDAKIRPFIFGGIGATQYSPAELKPELHDGTSGGKVQGGTKFSTSWGGGIKAYVSPHVGFRFMMRWTPTYINYTSTGFWCSPFGCYDLGKNQYSHAGEFSGGVIFRF